MMTQPCFLYNALAVIRSLCRSDPAQAEEATVQFADYLRGNADGRGKLGISAGEYADRYEITVTITLPREANKR